MYTREAKLTVRNVPNVEDIIQIDHQPLNSSITAGQGTSFNVGVADPDLKFRYQWYCDTTGGGTWTSLEDGGVYSGVKTDILQLTDVPISYNNYQYRCTVTLPITGRGAGMTSNAARLTVSEAPAAALGISGTTGMTLNTGYAAASTDAYTVSGAGAAVAKTSGNSAVTWNNGTKKLDIAAGLPVGVYPVELTASNGVDPNVLFTFTLTVEAATSPPDINGTSGMTLNPGYAAASTDPYAITGSPAPTVTKTSGNAAITWDNASKTLKIAAGLAKGTYPIVLTASNNSGETDFTFTLTVADPPPDANNAPATPTPADITIKLKIDDPYMYVNGVKQEIDPGRGTKPIIRNNRTILPIRAIVETMGGTVGWEDATRTVSLAANGHTVTMWLDKTSLVVDGKNLVMDVAPVSINDRTMVPVRFAAENLGCTVEWVEATREIIIRRV